MSRENLLSEFCDQVRLKPACSATEAHKTVEILDVIRPVAGQGS